MTNEKAKQVTNNGFYATDSEDGCFEHEDDDGDSVMEDYQSKNDNDINDDSDFNSESPTMRYERNNNGFEYKMDANKKIELKRKHIFFTIYDFRKVFQLFVV